MLTLSRELNGSCQHLLVPLLCVFFSGYVRLEIQLGRMKVRPSIKVLFVHVRRGPGFRACGSNEFLFQSPSLCIIRSYTGHLADICAWVFLIVFLRCTALQWLRHAEARRSYRCAASGALGASSKPVCPVSQTYRLKSRNKAQVSCRMMSLLAKKTNASSSDGKKPKSTSNQRLARCRKPKSKIAWSHRRDSEMQFCNDASYHPWAMGNP